MILKVPILRIPYTAEDISFIQNRVAEALKSGRLTLGKNVKEFEERFSKFCSAKYAIGTNSGTSALEIALRARNVEGGTVIVPANTFMATVFAPVHAGAKVIFVDVERETLSINPDLLQEKIRRDTKALCLVHVGGIISKKFNEIRKICNDNRIFLLEDAAHAHGATIDGKMAGSLGDAAAFSFFPTKVMTTCEGGIITTDDENIDRMSRTYRDEGKPDTSKNIHTVFGNNWRLSEVHAIFGVEQMNKIDWILYERRKIADWYDQKLKNVSGISLLKMPENLKSAYYKYVVYLDEGIEREKLKKELKERFDVSLTGEVYATSCHDQPVFDTYSHLRVNNKAERFPETEYINRHQICLPIYPGLSEAEVDYVVSSLKEVL